MSIPSVSIIIPTLNEVSNIQAQLEALQTLRANGCELILADGGSDDATTHIAQAFVDHCISSKPGRALQMNAGAKQSRGDVLLFLHADTALPENAITQIKAAIKQGASWGRFDVRIDSTRRMLRLVEYLMNWRSRLTGIATGDQAIFVRRDVFENIGGFPDLPLMEDIVLSKKLKQGAAPICFKDKVITSGRRWEKHGVLRTIMLMWRLRAAFFFGANPHRLAEQYGYGTKHTENLNAIQISIFAKAPQAGQAKTRLIPALGAAGAARLHRKLVLHALNTTSALTASSPAPTTVTLHCAPDTQHRFFRTLMRHCSISLKPQSGDDLGQRMAHAFNTHSTHDGPHLLIGTDCPALSVEHLKIAAQTLAEGNDAVFIPAEDGGYVLVGLRSPQPHLFENIDWGSDQVMKQTRERLKSLGLRWAEPLTLWDVDTPTDLLRLAKLNEFKP